MKFYIRKVRPNDAGYWITELTLCPWLVSREPTFNKCRAFRTHELAVKFVNSYFNQKIDKRY